MLQRTEREPRPLEMHFRNSIERYKSANNHDKLRIRVARPATAGLQVPPAFMGERLSRQ